MAPSIPGLKIKKSSEFLIAEISFLSDNLKSEIRDRLTAICYGEQLSLKNDGSYTYKETIQEFLKRFESKPISTQTGMVGEFMVHLLTGIMYPGYRTIVPFFNLEERNVKKGFDSVIYSAQFGIWIYEVKSSRHDQKPIDADRETQRLIKVAHDDLSSKLSDKDTNSRLWRSAMNGMLVACGHLKDEKAALENIIIAKQKTAKSPNCGPGDCNVMLSSVLIGNDTPGINQSKVSAKHDEHKATYNKLFIIAIHKSTKIELLGFLKEEAGA